MQEAVSRFVETANIGGENIWLGARLHELREWTWVNHIELTLTGVKVSESSGFLIKAAVTKNNTIEARHPGSELPYVCQYKVDDAHCKDSANHFEKGGSCFVFYSDEFSTWYGARNKCLKKGGDLATFAHVDSSVGVGQLATSPHWIGLRSSSWTWLNGREVAFSNWQHGEPASPSKLCVVISTHKENPWTWKTADCAEDVLRFICHVERPAPPTGFWFWFAMCLLAMVAFMCLCINGDRIFRCLRQRYVKLPRL